MDKLKLRLFGGFEARFAAGPALVFSTKKSQALLALVALTPGRAFPRDKIAALLWGDKEAEQARHSLRQAISSLRKVLPRTSSKYLVLEADSVALEPGAVHVDTVLFETYIADGSMSALEQAVALYAGPFLEGLDIKEEMFEEWLMTERERLHELALDATAKLLSHQLKNRLDDRAAQSALRLLALDPLQESVHRVLMRMYAKTGRRGAALMQYQQCVEILQRELGVQPEPETKQLYQHILQDAPEAAAAEMPLKLQSRRSPRRHGNSHSEAHSAETPLVGREAELARFRQTLRQAGAGNGRTVAVIGEAGIGKSRLVHELATEAVREGFITLVGHAYEIEQVLPFGPWINSLRSGKVIEDAEIVQRLNPVWRAELARLFPELGSPGIEISTSPENAVRLFEAVVHLSECLVSRNPLLWIFEDLQWSDEMSLRLFSFVSRRIQTLPLLLMGTAREEELGQAPLLSKLLQELERDRQAVSFTLAPLSRADAGTLIRKLGPSPVEDASIGRLEDGMWASSQGNPLIIVETMRALLEAGNLDPPDSSSLPKQVRTVVAQRLERLSARAKQLVALAAVIGREFDYVLLEQASAMSERDAAEGVEELVRRRVLHGVEERFDFTHERIRNVAYTGILPPRRKLLHAAVARALEEVYGGDLPPHYAALGVHYYKGGIWAKATEYLHKAGTAALARSAHGEAVAHFQQALDALAHLPESDETLKQAVAIRVDLGPALRIVKTSAAAEVMENYLQAQELCRKLEHTPQLFPVLWGLCRTHYSRGELHKSRELGEQLFTVAENIGDPALALEAHHTQWSTLFSLGELVSARDHVEQGRAIYDPRQHRRHAFLYGGHDPGVCCRNHAAHLLWLLGYPDQALSSSSDAIAFARELAHPFSLAFALAWSALLHQLRGDREVVQERCETAMQLASEHEFPRWVMLGTVLRGCLAAARGDLDQGIEHMRRGVVGMSIAERQPCMALLAQAYGQAQQAEKGLDVVAEAQVGITETGLRHYEAEILRIEGELLLQKSSVDEARAENCFRKALEVARSRSAKSLELRAATSLSRLWQKQGKSAQAKDLLGGIYDWFTEGFGTADLKEAKNLLASL